MRTLLHNARVAVCTGLAAATVGLAGCASHDHRYASARHYERDQQLAGLVYETLQSSPVYKFPSVAVHANNGRVQLSGFVASDAQRDAARDLAEHVPGVVSVDNDLRLARP